MSSHKSNVFARRFAGTSLLSVAMLLAVPAFAQEAEQTDHGCQR
jgi:hypothetical protein